MLSLQRVLWKKQARDSGLKKTIGFSTKGTFVEGMDIWSTIDLRTKYNIKTGNSLVQNMTVGKKRNETNDREKELQNHRGEKIVYQPAKFRVPHKHQFTLIPFYFPHISINNAQVLSLINLMMWEEAGALMGNSCCHRENMYINNRGENGDLSK